MIKVRAYMKLYKSGRETPFFAGYRPLFRFIDETQTSGSIELIDRNEFCPGEEGEVFVYFLNKDFLGKDFSVGKKFEFGEGNNILGEGIIKEILNY